MNIKDMAVQASLKLSWIPARLAANKAKNTSTNAIDSLRTIVYVQQARIEALERALLFAVDRLSVNGEELHNVRVTEQLLQLCAPECGHEPDDSEEDEPEHG